MEAVLNQTLKELEVICINDGSDDATIDILKEYAGKDSRIVLVDKENEGYAISLNLGISMAHGEYLAVLDPDDFPSLNMYEILYNKAKEYGLDFVKADFYRYSSLLGSVKCKIIEDRNYYNKLLTDFSIKESGLDSSTWSGIYKTDFVRDNNIKHLEKPGVSFCDQGFSFQIYMYAQRGMFLDIPLYNYRVDAVGSSMKCRKRPFLINDEYLALEDFISSNDDMSKFFPLLYYKKWYYYMWNYHRILPIYRPAVLLRMRKEFIDSEKQGHLNLEFFSTSLKHKLSMLIKNPFLFMLKIENEEKILKQRSWNMDIEKYFEDVDAQKQIDKLARKYKNKKIVIYGAGLYCRTLFENYDMSKLNIAAVADRSFEGAAKRDFFGQNCISPYELKEFDCDVILLGVQEMLKILDYLEDELLADTKNERVKIRPLIRKPFIYAIKEFFKNR